MYGLTDLLFRIAISCVADQILKTILMIFILRQGIVFICKNYCHYVLVLADRR